MRQLQVKIGTLLLVLALVASARLPGAAEEPARTAPDSTAPPSRPAPTVTAIGILKNATGTLVTINGDAEMKYEYFVIEGKSLLVDIPGATSKVWPPERQVDDEFVSSVRVAERSGENPGVRIALDLKGPAGFNVRGEGARITVAFATHPTESVAAATPPAAPRDPASTPAEGSLNRVAEVSAFRLPNVFRVAVKTDETPAYRVLDVGDTRRITVAVDNALLEPSARTSSDYSNLNEAVTRISALAQTGPRPAVLIAVDLRRPLPFRVFADGAGLNVDISTGLSRPEDALRPSPASAGAAPAAPPGGQSPDPAPAAYSGRTISLDFLDADIADIFRLISDISGMNIVVSDDVKGKRSVKMTEVPWDQALELILKTNIPPLVQIAESRNVIRITTQQRIHDEQASLEKRHLEQLQRASAEQKQALERAELTRRFEAENQAQLLTKVKAERQRSKGWAEKTFTISYGDTKEVASRLEKFFSGCKDGCIFEAGLRSKTIFVRDFVDNVEQMESVFQALEAPTSAIMVEARIVEVQSDYSEAIGIQWGGNFFADPAHGNATGLPFPNSIGIGGTQQEGGANPGMYLVNLPASGSVGGVGMTLGHIANTFSLDLRLSALEKLGKTKILSNPKVLVIQNEEANINVGSQLPVPKTDIEGNRTVEWKDVGILLKVTPNATPDGRVFMKIKIEKSAAGQTVKTTEGEMFSIERRGAETKVLVGDGETSVIGGIFQQTDSVNDTGIPGLSRLPLLGWLFKSKSVNNLRTELMIFLTPHIARDDAAISRDDARSPEPSTPQSGVGPADGPDAARGVFGAVTLVSADHSPLTNRIRAVVRYVNDTAFTFLASVTINCKAFGNDGKVIGADNAYIFSKDYGPIDPRFELEKELSLKLDTRGYATLRCSVLDAE